MVGAAGTVSSNTANNGSMLYSWFRLCTGWIRKSIDHDWIFSLHSRRSTLFAPRIQRERKLERIFFCDIPVTLFIGTLGTTYDSQTLAEEVPTKRGPGNERSPRSWKLCFSDSQRCIQFAHIFKFHAFWMGWLVAGFHYPEKGAASPESAGGGSKNRWKKFEVTHSSCW